MKHLIEEIKLRHEWHPPSDDIEQQVSKFYKLTGLKLPEDVIEFYRSCGRTTLFECYEIQPIENLLQVSMAIFGKENFCLDTLYAICDVMDGDWIGIELAKKSSAYGCIIDCDHEDIVEVAIIASSLEELLSIFLESGPEKYWLGSEFQPIGVISNPHTSAFWRDAHASWWDKLGEEIGPELCAMSDCRRKRIRFSVKCRRHHYEMIWGHACPFDDKLR